MSGYEITSWDLVIIMVTMLAVGAGITATIAWAIHTVKMVKMEQKLEEANNF